MCDYSLHATPNRLAVDGEQLVAHRFTTGSMGLACPAELNPPARQDQPRSIWAAIGTWFRAQTPRVTKTTAVCIPPGARLVLHDVPEDLQREVGVGESEEVTFVQLSASAYRYRDGVRFQNGREILLQSLREGQRVDVVCLNPVESAAEVEHQREVLTRLR